jgi:hypothetical protein
MSDFDQTPERLADKAECKPRYVASTIVLAPGHHGCHLLANYRR